MLLTRMSANKTAANCCGMVVKFFKQTLHLPVAVTQEHNIIGVSEVTNVVVRTNLNPWVDLQGVTRNPVNNAVEEGRREYISLWNAGAYLKRQ